MAFIIGCTFEFVSQLPWINVRLCNDVQCIGITDRINAECQSSFLAICGDNFCLLGILVVILDKLDYVVHVEEARQLISHFAQPACI